VITNKVTHIINCAGRQVPNFWESIGVTYLTYNWADSDNQVNQMNFFLKILDFVRSKR
jgi:hypothetical protein